MLDDPQGYTHVFLDALSNNQTNLLTSVANWWTLFFYQLRWFYYYYNTTWPASSSWSADFYTLLPLQSPTFSLRRSHFPTAILCLRNGMDGTPHRRVLQRQYFFGRRLRQCKRSFRAVRVLLEKDTISLFPNPCWSKMMQETEYSLVLCPTLRSGLLIGCWHLMLLGGCGEENFTSDSFVPNLSGFAITTVPHGRQHSHTPACQISKHQAFSTSSSCISYFLRLRRRNGSHSHSQKSFKHFERLAFQSLSTFLDGGSDPEWKGLDQTILSCTSGFSLIDL